jgi:hypothetical protein
LVVVADNCSENKNNTVFAFFAHLVHMKWYDSIELLFGPVGHTHNGVDQDHGVHNPLFKEHESATLVVRLFSFLWLFWLSAQRVVIGRNSGLQKWLEEGQSCAARGRDL